eukprot:CAMPEP_0170518414 /NCGR_PEP_ID=MMETSP0209-20121228/4111_1 /TAXON_ID=665100 ORGANISM="Litonotus pictus, Strain P1" /NCGR_SAMPLE_ID=MMETSP0209 /ASSEMBLY_ACC=CAM_ASM_000301 /LENGTH=234 /DNA_ID=CAMNT_0010803965 /DNA_START=107 /DNA_END=811 /DNA_ORIENTATION=-
MLESVIQSHQTPLLLNSEIKPSKEISEFSRYRTIASTGLKNSSERSRFRSVDASKDDPKMVSPVIIRAKVSHNNNTQRVSSNPPQKSQARKKVQRVSDFGSNLNLYNRVNDASLQTVSNKEAFNAAFPDPEDYKRKTEVKIIDPLYNSLRDDLKEYFKDLLTKNFQDVIERVDEIDKPYNLVNTQNKEEDFFQKEKLEKTVERLSKVPEAEELSTVTTFDHKGERKTVHNMRGR